jgi:two-component system sensor kinase FixL
MDQTANGINCLQTRNTNLLSLLALPFAWWGNESSTIVSTMFDVLLRMLCLDFAYARLSHALHASPSEVLRSAQCQTLATQPSVVGRALNRWLTGDLPAAPLVVPNPLGAGNVSIAFFRLGIRDNFGVFVAGSQRADFPTQRERLLLQLAANQAAMGLREARGVCEQRRVAEKINFHAGLLDAVDQAVIAIDLHGVITYWNRFAERLYGWLAEAVIGRNLMSITHVPGSQGAAAEILSRWQRGVRWTGECLMQHRDGMSFPVQVTDAPIYNTQGVLIGVARVSIDITERKRAEEDLEQRVIELTTAIAHEVKQPLTAVINNGNACLRWLARATPDLEAVRGALRGIITNGQRANNIITQILAALKKAPPQMVRLDLNRVILEVVELIHYEVQRHEVRLCTNLAAGLPPVSGDRVQLQQVLLNLVLNGIEAMSTVTDRPRELLLRSGHTEAGEVLVVVQDCGIGLDPMILERIFDAFFSTKPEGLGIGLAISRTIIQAHGGRLWAERNPGLGTTVQFSLPIAGEHEDD